MTNEFWIRFKLAPQLNHFISLISYRFLLSNVESIFFEHAVIIPRPQKCQLYPDVTATFFFPIPSPHYAVNPFLVVTDRRNSLRKRPRRKRDLFETLTLRELRISIKNFLADGEYKLVKWILGMEKQREMSTNGHLSRTSDSFSTPPLKSAKLRPPLSTLIPSSARGSIKLNHVDHVLVGERNCSPGPTIRSTIAIPPFLPPARISIISFSQRRQSGAGT